jgi:Ca2+-binding RTX toxin-like protein
MHVTGGQRQRAGPEKESPYMPTQNTNRNTTWMIDASNQTWTLTKDAKITVNNGHGIYEGGQDGSTIKVLGDIEVKGMAYGVYLNGSNSELNVGANSHIDAAKGVSGIFSAAAGAHIVNRGLVEGDDYGVQGAIWSDVENYGTIRGFFGIEHDGSGSQIYNYGEIDGGDYGISSDASGTLIENAKGAEISGDLNAILLNSNGTANIVNHGILRSDGAAIESAMAELIIKNTGKIVGDILLGEGEDILDTRKGTVNGRVEGGDGDDDFYVGAAKIKIIEQSGAGTGFDEVFATASHKLAANVEVLHLLGNKNINATGNGAGNLLYGNEGDNVLKGGGGTDYLRGFGGDDTLEGGNGQDYFVFNRAGVDRITDFADMTDLVSIAGVTSQSDFDALNIKQVNGDTVINFGGGDKVIIEDLLKSNFTYDDIAVI